ncbi:hypothetical protein LCGC14_2001490 [marine sediment metagenome]|uniref:Glycosyl transferase family 1 domain-containing protein n=1 Tax=marine sediment metagenome TaxID=412755 RepID=A0A0F9HGK2_9ZZZZ
MKLVAGGLFQGCDLWVVTLIRGKGNVMEQLVALGCDASFLIDKPQMSHADLVNGAQLFRRCVARIAPDIVIASLPQANLVARVSLMRRRDIKLISFEHNTHLAKRAYEIAFRATSGRVDCTFADAAFTLETVFERLYRKTPAAKFVVPLVDFGPSERAPRGLAGRNAHIINAARFTDVKNQAALIEAVAILRRDGYAVRLTLYGDGPNRDAYCALAARLGVADAVEMAGFVTDWPARDADAFVLASHHEGLCIVLLEAMHAGIPVAGPILGGVRDYGSPEVMKVVPDVSAAALAQAIRDMIDDPEATRERAARAVDLVDSRYGRAATRARYCEVNAALRDMVGFPAI